MNRVPSLSLTKETMYYIKVTTNATNAFWNEEAKAFCLHLENATRFANWKDADRRCEVLNSQYNGTQWQAGQALGTC